MDEDASCELVRVIAGCGWAVHALVFEFSDGKRYGTIQSNGCTALPLTDASIEERCDAATTIDIAPGDAVVRAEGHGLRDCPDYLCWGVSLLMASGARHDVCSVHEEWKGAPFEFDIAFPTRVLVELAFERHAVSARTTQPPEVAVPPAERATVATVAVGAGAGAGAGAATAAPAVAAAAPAAPAAAAAAGQAGGGGGTSSSSSDDE